LIEQAVSFAVGENVGWTPHDDVLINGHDTAAITHACQPRSPTAAAGISRSDAARWRRFIRTDPSRIGGRGHLGSSRESFRNQSPLSL